MRQPTALGHSCWGQSWEGMSSLWGERDEAQLLDSYLWMILHSREQSLWRWLGEGARNWGALGKERVGFSGGLHSSGSLVTDPLWACQVACQASWIERSVP